MLVSCLGCYGDFAFPGAVQIPELGNIVCCPHCGRKDRLYLGRGQVHHASGSGLPAQEQGAAPSRPGEIGHRGPTSIPLLPKPPLAVPPAPVVSPTRGLVALGRNAQGYEEWRNEKNGAVLIRVPGCTFTMGSTSGEDDEKPPFSVTLPSYLVGKFAVTNAQFERFVAETGHRTEAETSGGGWVWRGEWTEVVGSSWRHPWGPGTVTDDAMPVVQVSWNDAVAYGKWAGLRLLTEAEWEFAARGPGGREFPWGPNFDATRCCNSVGCKPGEPRGCMAVGSFLAGASPVGCLDMAGNVWEWCSSKYGPYDQPLGREALEGSEPRVLRGGSSVDTDADFFRGAFRLYDIPNLRFVNYGFRLGRDGWD